MATEQTYEVFFPRTADPQSAYITATAHEINTSYSPSTLTLYREEQIVAYFCDFAGWRIT